MSYPSIGHASESLTFGAYGEARVIVPAPENERYQHLAWPKIVKAPDGTLVVAYIAARKHVAGDGCPAVSISKDGGASFSEPRILAHYDSRAEYEHAANLAIGLAPDEAVVLMGMTHTGNKRNDIFGWRSEDSGETWQPVDASALGKSQTGSVFGHIFETPDKGLTLTGHYRLPRGFGIWIAYSQDEGRSWGPPKTLIADTKWFEPTLWFTEGRIVGHIRDDTQSAYQQIVSDDQGETWTEPQLVLQRDEGRSYPSPFIISDPNDPTTIYALQSERIKEPRSAAIYLWKADASKLDWERQGLIVKATNIPDFSYPWMTHLEGHKWFLVFYSGEIDGPSSIYGMEIALP